jgi:GT2 family glycosyltransferase
MTILAIMVLGLSLLYAGMTFLNLLVFRPLPPPAGPVPPISILIPARDEEANIATALACARSLAGAELEILVLDDASRDGTARIVREAALVDPRIRLIDGLPLPQGWNGKQHACWQLSEEARHPVLVFVDADVRLAPDSIARLVTHMERHRLDMVSGFPRQITRSLAERLVIPQILVVLLGYLPIMAARRSRDPKFATACGQLIAIRRELYQHAGGHRAVRASMHDGLVLPRAVRRHGGTTDIVNATDIAACRMYETWHQVWRGFSKNATEGMAKPVALPVWTLLLGGGHVLPYILVFIALGSGQSALTVVSGCALALLLSARVATALVAKQGWLPVLIHPLGILVTLTIQWTAFIQSRRGRQQSWRGRTYDVR